jgi:hypothetical protein
MSASSNDSKGWSLWSWSVVGTGFVFVYGAGLVALSLDQFDLAAILLVEAIACLTVKALTSPELGSSSFADILLGSLLCFLSLSWVQSRLDSMAERHPNPPQASAPQAASASQAPLITWKTPSPIEAGVPLSEKELNASASFGGKPVDGRFVYNPTRGATLEAGTDTLVVTFYPADSTKYSMQIQTIALIVKPSSHRPAPPIPPVPPGQNSTALESGKPQLDILDDSINGESHGHNRNRPPIPLSANTPKTSFVIGVKNFGQRSAQSPTLTGRLRFPDPRVGLNLRAEMKDECEHPSQFMGDQGPSVGPMDTKFFLSAATTDFPGLKTQLLTGEGAVRGYLIGCVTYHDDLIERPLHSAFVFDVTFGPNTPRTRQFIRDFREHNGIMGGPADSLPYDEVYFIPDDRSPYFY